MSAVHYSAVRSTLAGNGGLSALVGTRIFANFLPEGQFAPNPLYPCISFDIDEENMPTHDEDSNGRFAELLVECTVYSKRRDPASELAPIETALQAAVLGLSGSINGRTYSGARFDGAAFAVWVPGSECWEKDLRYRVMVSD